MISDWTIYGVFCPYDGPTCTSCFDIKDEWEDLPPTILEIAQEAELAPNLGNLRKLWSHQGLTVGQSDRLSNAGYPPWSGEFPHQPKISAEISGWEDMCWTCEGHETLSLNDLWQYFIEHSENPDEDRIEYFQSLRSTLRSSSWLKDKVLSLLEGGEFPCPDPNCSCGVTPARCYYCGEFLVR